MVISREGEEEGHYRGKRIRGTKQSVKSKPKECIVQHAEYGQCFIITISGV